MKEIGGFKVLPPAAGKCQVCAAEHDPTQPHNQQSLYYQFTFNAEHGRSPTWEDSMAHCSPEVKSKWKAGFIHMIRDQKAGIFMNIYGEGTLREVMSKVSVDAITSSLSIHDRYYYYKKETNEWVGSTTLPEIKLYYFKLDDLC